MQQYVRLCLACLTLGLLACLCAKVPGLTSARPLCPVEWQQSGKPVSISDLQQAFGGEGNVGLACQVSGGKTFLLQVELCFQPDSLGKPIRKVRTTWPHPPSFASCHLHVLVAAPTATHPSPPTCLQRHSVADCLPVVGPAVNVRQQLRHERGHRGVRVFLGFLGGPCRSTGINRQAQTR